MSSPAKHLLAAVGVFSVSVAAQTAVVSPREFATNEGNLGSNWLGTATPSRRQQLHGDVPPTVIRRMAFRRDTASMGSLAGFQVDLRMILTTSPNPPGTASSEWRRNFGSDQATVIARRRVQFPPSVWVPKQRVQPDVFYQLPLDRPFTFFGGTLLWDALVYSTTPATRLWLDECFAPGGGVHAPTFHGHRVQHR